MWGWPPTQLVLKGDWKVSSWRPDRNSMFHGSISVSMKKQWGRAATFVPCLFGFAEYLVTTAVKQDTGIDGPFLIWLIRSLLTFLGRCDYDCSLNKKIQLFDPSIEVRLLLYNFDSIFLYVKHFPIPTSFYKPINTHIIKQTGWQKLVIHNNSQTSHESGMQPPKEAIYLLRNRMSTASKETLTSVAAGVNWDPIRSDRTFAAVHLLRNATVLADTKQAIRLK